MTLEEMGWNADAADALALWSREHLAPARVVTSNRGVYTVQTEFGPVQAELAGRLRHEADQDHDLPVVGDWVGLSVAEENGRGVIHALLPRATCISRKRAGKTSAEQVLAANVDVALLVSALDGARGMNLRRMERYLMLAWESGAAPVVVLNKADVCEDVEAAMRSAESVAAGVPVLAVSATEGTGMEALRHQVRAGQTAVLLGMSGVGKSALINALAGEPGQRVGDVRESDRRGRHTTTQSRLIHLPGGGMIIDTPGLRELQPWVGETGMDATFADVEALAERCRFRDCRHEGEPDCAVQEALADGALDWARYENYLHLRREQAFLESKIDERAARAERERHRKFGKMVKDLKQRKKKW